MPKKGERIDPTTDPIRHGYYGGRNKDGSPCGQPVVKGTQTCKMHSGVTLAKLKAKGAVVVELKNWGLGDTKIDPGEVLLRLVTQSAARVDLYSALLQEAFEAAGRLRVAERDATRDVPGAGADAERARQDLDRIFNQGPVAVLIGHTYAATKDGDIYATGEKLRGLVELEADERDRCANFAARAVAAGLAERQVRLAEQQGALMASLYRGALDDADLDPESRQRVEAAFVRRLTMFVDTQSLTAA